MKLLSDKEVKGKLLEMLLFIDEVCKEHNLEYFLDSGTLIGAVRHKGFIPWDDDIDIILPRDDYDKLIEVLNTNGRYQSIDYKNHEYLYPFAKVMDTKTVIELENYFIVKDLGLYIDLFPLDGLPDGKIKRKVYFKIIWYIRNILAVMVVNNPKSLSAKEKIARYIGLLIGGNRLNKFIEKESKKYSYKDSMYVTSLMASFKREKVLEKNWFESSIQIQFENKKLPIPIGFDSYLKELYGDYMKLPSLEEQINHGYKAYLKGEK